MSLVALALRICTVHALRGRTPAGPKIFDSMTSAIDDLAGDQGSGALAVVYTDEDKIEPVGFGNPIQAGGRHLSLLIDCAIADKIVLEQGGASIEIGETDAAREAAIDLFVRDVLWTLQSDPGPFAECWRLLKGQIRDIHAKRGAGSDKGIKFAARELTLTLDAADEPSMPAGADGDWRMVLDTLNSEPPLRPIASLIEARLGGSVDPPDWQALRAMLGLTGRAADAIGLAPQQANPYPLPGEAPDA